MKIHRITYNPQEQSCSLYFIGCNFSCIGCYWKQIYGRVNIRLMKFLNLDETIDIMRPAAPKRVCMISGEPRPCPEYDRLPQALHEAFGCEVRLMTNGHILPRLSELHHASVSIKAYDNKLHRTYTGKSNVATLQNFRLLHESGVEVSASSVLIPGQIDQEEIINIARFIAGVDRNIPYRIIGYMPVEGLSYRPPTYDELEETATRAKEFLNNVIFSDPTPHDYTGIEDLFTNNLRK